jgi:hypothetical protein
MSTNWKADGTYFESCNCDVVCPCVFTSAPTEGNCKVLIAWHIDNGSYGELSLDGLNVVMAVYSPGHMLETPWQVALYLDESGSAEQQQALGTIFGGQAGGAPAALVPLIGEVLGVRSTAIDFSANGKTRSLKIDGIAEAAIEGIAGQGGGEVTVTGHPIAVSPGHPAVAAKSEKFSYEDFGLNWEFSGKTGFYAPFTYQGS